MLESGELELDEDLVVRRLRTSTEVQVNVPSALYVCLDCLHEVEVKSKNAS